MGVPTLRASPDARCSLLFPTATCLIFPPPRPRPRPRPPPLLCFCLRSATSPASGFRCSKSQGTDISFGQIPAPDKVLRRRQTNLNLSKCTVVLSAIVSSLEPDGESGRGPAEEREVGAEVEPISGSSLLWRAAKLPIYSVAFIPLCVGSAAVYLEKRLFSFGSFLLFCISSFLIIAWLNLSNDAYDAETGVDKDKQESVVNIFGSQRIALIAAYTCLVIGLSGFSWGAFQTADVRVAVLLFAAISCGYVYQCPPFRLSYKGLGEPLCFLAFGPLATTAFYLSQAHERNLGILQLPKSIIAASVMVGITTSLILFCSHFHQIKGDYSVGKISPLVRIGTEAGARVVEQTVDGLYLLLAMFGMLKFLPMYTTMLGLVTYPFGKLVKDYVKANHSNTEAIFLAKYYCVKLHVAFGFALALGFWVTTMLPALPF